MSVRRSASGDGVKPFGIEARQMKWSISLRGHVVSETSGSSRLHGRDERPVLGVDGALVRSSV